MNLYNALLQNELCILPKKPLYDLYDLYNLYDLYDLYNNIIL